MSVGVKGGRAFGSEWIFCRSDPNVRIHLHFYSYIHLYISFILSTPSVTTWPMQNLYRRKRSHPKWFSPMNSSVLPHHHQSVSFPYSFQFSAFLFFFLCHSTPPYLFYLILWYIYPHLPYCFSIRVRIHSSILV